MHTLLAFNSIAATLLPANLMNVLRQQYAAIVCLNHTWATYGPVDGLNPAREDFTKVLCRAL